jgi:hypothetical protein
MRRAIPWSLTPLGRGHSRSQRSGSRMSKLIGMMAVMAACPGAAVQMVLVYTSVRNYVCKPNSAAPPLWH